MLTNKVMAVGPLSNDTCDHLTQGHCNQLVDVNTDMLPGLCLAGDCWRAGAEKVGSPHSTAQHSHWCADTGDQP